MADFIFLMHELDAEARPEGGHPDWSPYLKRLEARGALRGGSAIGRGICVRKSGEAPAITGRITGFIRIEATSLDEARALLDGNPVYEAGGTVEIRELPRT